MTREEAIKYLIQPIVSGTNIGKEKQKELDAYNMAIKALKQEPVLDKIRAEIEALNEKVSVDYKMCLDKSAVLQIIDKYMAERSEE